MNCNLLNKFCFLVSTASPANSKLTQRMTTLHEEPIRNCVVQEESEESDYPEYECDNVTITNSNDFYAKSRMRSSHTIDSFMDIEKKTSTSSTNLLNYRLLTQNQAYCNALKKSRGTDRPSKAGKTDVVNTSPSMNSSTSSGYESQSVSIGNLTTDDTTLIDGKS